MRVLIHNTQGCAKKEGEAPEEQSGLKLAVQAANTRRPTGDEGCRRRPEPTGKGTGSGVFDPVPTMKPVIGKLPERRTGGLEEGWTRAVWKD